MRPGLFSTWQIYQISSARSGKRSQMARRRVIWEARGIVQASGSWWMKTSPQAVPGHTPVTWLLRFNRITGPWKFNLVEWWPATCGWRAVPDLSSRRPGASSVRVRIAASRMALH